MEQQTLEKKIAQLPDLMKLKLEGYVDALLEEAEMSLLSQQIAPTRGYGSLKDKIWMADDFDAPLNDFKDYM